MAITFLLLLLLMGSLTSASALKEVCNLADLLLFLFLFSNTLNAKLRLRRAPRYAVCKSRKCRFLNSGNALPQLSNRKLEEGAAKAQDPYGFGR
uniref:Secreted protein n=1 Tax=Xiphophorus couchianus TaxID=32473 RepID=A0A3B5L3D4_9TELE